jgi:hypothetical protein
MVESIKRFSSSRNTRTQYNGENEKHFKVAQSQFIERLKLNPESVLRFDS